MPTEVLDREALWAAEVVAEGVADDELASWPRGAVAMAVSTARRARDVFRGIHEAFVASLTRGVEGRALAVKLEAFLAATTPRREALSAAVAGRGVPMPAPLGQEVHALLAELDTLLDFLNGVLRAVTRPRAPLDPDRLRATQEAFARGEGRLYRGIRDRDGA